MKGRQVFDEEEFIGMAAGDFFGVMTDIAVYPSGDSRLVRVRIQKHFFDGQRLNSECIAWISRSRENAARIVSEIIKRGRKETAVQEPATER